MIKITGKFFLLLFAFEFISILATAQEKSNTCADLKSGTFHQYPKNTNAYFIQYVEGEFNHETNGKTGDTSLYKIKWLNDCTYELKLVSTNVSFDKGMADFLRKHSVVFKITNITHDYYTYTAHVDKPSKKAYFNDTIWFAEKIKYTGNELFRQISFPLHKKEEQFSDTSQYALVYLYRPEKMQFILDKYPVYLEDNFMCLTKNKSGYAFKILKEGQYPLKSALWNNTAILNLDIKFGKEYYIKSTMNWGIQKNLTNFRLELKEVEPVNGITEFMEVNQE